MSLEAISAALPKSSCEDADKIRDKDLRKDATAAIPPPSSTISKFALIRFDELDGVALQLSKILDNSNTITADVLRESLSRLRDSKTRCLAEYCRFISDPEAYERFDASKSASWIVTDIEGVDLKKEKLVPPFESRGEGTYIEAAIGDYRYVNVAGFAPEPVQFDASNPFLGAIRLKSLGTAD